MKILTKPEHRAKNPNAEDEAVVEAAAAAEAKLIASIREFRKF